MEEFFELFKVPWEFYKEGQMYDVVVATADDIPDVGARLLLAYGSETKSIDPSNGITVRSRQGGGSLDCPRLTVPIYGHLATFEPGGSGIPCITASVGIAGLRLTPAAGGAVLRLGYDLFEEAQLLFSAGQPIEQAHIPTLDIHIRMLRNWILSEGIPLLEVPAAPADHAFAVCLTHDIDFMGIRDHKFDHTMWGFLYRSTVGAVRRLFQRRISITHLLDSWRAAVSLPLVHLGLAKDFWEPFGWYLEADKGLPATYFLIPFKRRAGERVPGRHADRRATAYDVGDLAHWTATLKSEGCELGVHGIDAWHSVEKGHAELRRIAATTGESSSIGIRMHWLLHDANTVSTLEEGGYAYDSTLGYNETVGYRCGTTQVFRPLGAKALLELPLHVQDGALFYPQRLNLTEPEAEKCCGDLIDHARRFGGVLTVLWHDRSHAPERFWGAFYIRLVQTLKSSGAWFATGGQAVRWFRKRRQVRFERAGGASGVRCILPKEAEAALPSLSLTVYRPSLGGSDTQPSLETRHAFIDIPCHAGAVVEFDSFLNRVSQVPVELSAIPI